MQFILRGRDGTDSEALNRRIQARAAHMEYGSTLKAQGKLLFAAALLDDEQVMRGSVMVFETADRNELEKLLETEPYITGGVWKDIEILSCRTAPAFQPAVASQS